MLGVGSPEEAERTTTWARWLLRGGVYGVYSNDEPPPTAPMEEKISAADLASASAAGLLKKKRMNTQDSGYYPPQVLPIAQTQEHIRNSIKYADATRLRFWVKTLRDEVIREAAFNNHQSILISQLRALCDAQQRELATARVTLRRMKGSVERSKINTKRNDEISAISHNALRMAGKSRLNAEDERESMMGELERLRTENAMLRNRSR